MMWSDFLAAIALCLVIEGLVPFASPGLMKRKLKNLLDLGDRELRITGLCAMLVGLAFLYWARS